jgi:hypothetical protein
MSTSVVGLVIKPNWTLGKYFPDDSRSFADSANLSKSKLTETENQSINQIKF